MPHPMNVDPESLLTSSAVVDRQSRELSAAQASADTAVDSALAGWVGQSRAALAAAAEQWAADIAAVTARIHRHGEGLRVSGLSFAEMDREHARALALGIG